MPGSKERKRKGYHLCVKYRIERERERERQAGKVVSLAERDRILRNMPHALNTWDSPPPLRLPCHAVWLWSCQPYMGLPCRNVAFGICCPGGMKWGSGMGQNHLSCQPRLLAGSCAQYCPGPIVNILSLSHAGV